MRAFLIAAGIVLVVGGLWAYSTFTSIFGSWDTYSWNQKLTVTVETPEGERSGSAVSHVELMLLKPGSQSISAASAGEHSVGEAVVVSLPNGRVLFMLRYHDASIPSQNAFVDTLMTESERDKLYYLHDFYRKLVWSNGLSGPLPLLGLPRFVTFDDLSDPTSVKLVDPKDLAATFGPGYALKSVTLEITRDGPRFGKVEEVLGKDFFRNSATIHHDALKRGLDDAYFDTLLSKLSRNEFIQE